MKVVRTLSVVRQAIPTRPIRTAAGRHTTTIRRLHTSPTCQDKQSSVSADEVSHFNALAADWWSPYGSSRLLHLMNPLRHDFINSCRAISSSKQRLRYLDIGCGGGIFAESAARLPDTQTVLGIDPTPGVLAVARNHARQDPLLHQTGRLEYRQTPIEGLDVPGSPAEQYDVVSMFEVIEHVERPSDFLKRVLPFVKPGGWIVGSTIARTWTSWITTKLVAEDILRIVPPGTHDWNKYLNENEIRAWFDKAPGWDSFRSQGVVYVPALGWKVVEGSEQYGNYFFAARKAEETTA